MPPFRGGDPGSNPGTSTIFPEDVVTLNPSNIGTSTLSQIHLIYLNVEGLSLGCGKPVVVSLFLWLVMGMSLHRRMRF